LGHAFDESRQRPEDEEMAGGRLTFHAKLRWRRLRWFIRFRAADSDPIPLVLTQTFVVATVLSAVSLGIDWASTGAQLRQTLIGKAVITLGFGVAAGLALFKKRRAALWFSLVVTVGAVSSVAEGFGPNARGFLQLSALLLMPFIAVVGTLGDVKFASVAGLTVTVSAQVVAAHWALSLQDRVMCLFIMGIATAVAIAMAFVLGELKRQALHDQRSSQRVARRLSFSQQERAKAERLAVVGQLASTMAHEINNPLAFTLANLRFIGDALKPGARPDAGELKEVLGETEEGLQRIASIVERMSVFRLPSKPLPHTTELRQALEAFVSSLEAKDRSKAPVVLEPGPALPPVMLDAQRLSRVLHAVVTNAVQAVEKVGAGEPKAVRISTAVTDEQVQLVVDDDGAGIDPQVLGRLFEPFAMTPGAGKLGLSLALARELVRSIGGDVLASNRSGGGARVVVALPIVKPERA
jgi:signal transduction histidine kinase